MHRKIVFAAGVAALGAALGGDSGSGSERRSGARCSSGRQGAGVASACGIQEVLAAYRQIIVLFADEQRLSRGAISPTRWDRPCSTRTASASAVSKLPSTATASGRVASVSSLLDYVESDPDLYDADRLAFRELLRSLRRRWPGTAPRPPSNCTGESARIFNALAEIERNYEKEIRQVFGRFDSRAIELKRERWEDYVAKLKTRYSRDQILKDQGFVLPYAEATEPADPGPRGKAKKPKDEKEAKSSAPLCRPRPWY